MQCSVPADRGGAPSSAEADDSGGSAVSKEEQVSCAHFCTMSRNSLSALVVALHANALRKFSQPATHGAPFAIFVLPIPSPSTWSNEFSCFIAQVTTRTKAATRHRVRRRHRQRGSEVLDALQYSRWRVGAMLWAGAPLPPTSARLWPTSQAHSDVIRLYR